MSSRDEAINVRSEYKETKQNLETRDKLLYGILCALISIAYDVWHIKKNR